MWHYISEVKNDFEKLGLDTKISMWHVHRSILTPKGTRMFYLGRVRAQVWAVVVWYQVLR